MRCPVCNSSDTKVTDSRVLGDGMGIKRRRECEKCGYRFSTREETEIFDLAVIKRDGSREPYDKQKLISGLEHSLHKLPVTSEAFNRLVQLVERDIQKKKKSELTSSDIGEIVMKRLKSFNKVAYIRFASVYRSFQDVSGFEEEIKTLLGARKQATSRAKKKSKV